ncbi:large exoprotein [Microbacterium sp.]|uniref:large exoprotein n=1 Tax=Microbacterium sp. TaxID=51671 RepID=UPI0025F7DFC3|nr:large exoprotein [Microbacterium sp.]
MGGQVLGGGVVVAVAVALWLVYLLPSWHGRHQYNAAERNAVRLSRALRVLAETSETPREVHLELNARTALAQQRLARRAQSERERARLESAKAELAAERAQSRRDAALARERAASASAAAAAVPAVRRARTRRRVRLGATAVGLVAAGLAGWGGVEVAHAGSPALLWSAVAVMSACGLALQRIWAVQRRALQRERVAVAPRAAGHLQDVALRSESTTWTPRELPRPLTASAGSRAAAVLDVAEAREGLRRAAVEEAMRARAERARPPSIQAARAARGEEFTGSATTGDDAIEAHVRQLLERRASGQ